MPYAGDCCAAEFTLITGQIISGNKIPLPLDQQFLAIVAIGVVSIMSGHVADIGVADTLLHGQFAVAGQCGHRGRGQSVQFVAREKT